MTITVADAFTGQYRDEAAFVASLIGTLAIEMRRKGWSGCRVAEADWHAEDGKAPVMLIQIAPGERELTIEAVRAKVKERRAQARVRQKKIEAAQAEGRLI